MTIYKLYIKKCYDVIPLDLEHFFQKFLCEVHLAAKSGKVCRMIVPRLYMNLGK